MQANHALSELTGYSPAQLARMNVLDLLAPDHRGDGLASVEELAGGRSDRYVVERELIRADGSAVWVVGHVAAIQPGGQHGYAVSYIQDVTARKRAEADLARRAFTDELTGMANRHLVMDHLALALRQEVRTGRAVGVLYLDIDHFKDINDAHGHDAGDRVLREIAGRLTLGMRSADTPGRLGGDEFIVVCPQLASDSELTTVAERLLQAVCARSSYRIRQPSMWQPASGLPPETATARPGNSCAGRMWRCMRPSAEVGGAGMPTPKRSTTPLRGGSPWR